MRFVAVLVFFAPLFVFAQQPSHQASITNIYTEEGNLQMVISYDPVNRSRVYTEYYSNGKMYSKKTMRVENNKEQRDGEEIIYYPNGNIRKYTVWKDAMPFGRVYVNYDNGKLEHEEFYEGKYKSGTWRYYSPTGELVKEISFEKGRTPWNGKVNIGSEKRYAAGRVSYAGPAVAATSVAKQRTAAKPKTIVKPMEPLNAKALFQSNCSSCHAPHADGKGPALAGVTKRRDNVWLTQMIKDGNLLLDLEDKEAQKLFRKWNAMRHPTFKKFTQQEINALIAYLATMDEKPKK